jgi:hypothetical protein
MNKLTLIFMLIVGILLASVGAYTLIEEPIALSECAHSPIPSTCGPNPELGNLFVYYPATVIGLVLVAYSLIKARHQSVNKEKP